MIKVNDVTKHIEIPYLLEKGKAAIKTLDHLQIIAYRVDLKKLAVEIILANSTEDGTIKDGTTQQFCLTGDDALQFIDNKKFDDFLDHLEDIAVASSAPEYAALQKRGKALAVSCEKVVK